MVASQHGPGLVYRRSTTRHTLQERAQDLAPRLQQRVARHDFQKPLKALSALLDDIICEAVGEDLYSVSALLLGVRERCNVINLSRCKVVWLANDHNRSLRVNRGLSKSASHRDKADWVAVQCRAAQN